MFGRPLSGLRKAGLSRPAILLGTLLAAFAAGPAAHAVTFITVDGHPNPVTLVAGETVIIRLDASQPGGQVLWRFNRDLTHARTYAVAAPVLNNGSFLDGSGQDSDPTPGRLAMPFVVPLGAAGPYVLHLNDVANGSSLDLPGVTLVPKPQAQGITGHVAVLFPAGGGFVPDDAVIWAYAGNAGTPVASASIQPDGSYSLPLLPGSYRVFAEWLGNLHSQRQLVNVFAAQNVAGIDLALIEGQEVVGTVRSGGQPVAGAVVQAVTAAGAVVDTQTLADGSYILVLPAGKSRVFAGGMTADVTVVDGPVDRVDFPPAAPGATPAAGTIVTIAGSGISGYGGEGGPATTARLIFLQGLAVDKAGNLYTSMNGWSQIRKVDAQTGIITTIAGGSPFFLPRGLAYLTAEYGSYGGDGGPATQALLNSPQHLTLDAAGNLYVSDLQNQRVRKIDPNGIITTVVGTGIPGFDGDGGPATQAQINNPQGVAVDRAGNLYVADARNSRVRKVSPNGIIATVAGGGTGAAKDGVQATTVALATPRELAVDPAGNLFIWDAGLNRMLKMSPGGILTLFAGTGIPGFSGDGGPATQAQFNSTFPRFTVDSAGNLFFPDAFNHRVRKIGPDGIVTTVVGSGPVSPNPGSFAGDGGPALAARLWTPSAVTIDAAGNLYIADVDNIRIRKVMGIAAPGLVAGQ